MRAALLLVIMASLSATVLASAPTGRVLAADAPQGAPGEGPPLSQDPRVIPNPNFPELHQLLMARDPFKRPDFASGEVEIKAPLQSFPVDAFRMVGVLTGPLRKSAMLLAPDGKTYVVRQRSRIGLKDGVVLRVEDEKVVVREKVSNIFGETEIVDEEIVLQKTKILSSLGGKDADEGDLPSAPKSESSLMGIPAAGRGAGDAPKVEMPKKDAVAPAQDKTQDKTRSSL